MTLILQDRSDSYITKVEKLSGGMTK